MKSGILLAVFLFYLVNSNAQIQFWNIKDMEEMPQQAIRKELKVKQTLVYRTDQTGQIKDSTDIEEIRDYNRNGQLIASTTFKYDWNARKKYILRVDSFHYNANSQLSSYHGYEGPNYNRSYETQVQYNKNNRTEQMNHYMFTGGLRSLETYDKYEWNEKSKVIKVTKFNADKKINTTQQFTYDAAGRLTKESSRDNFGSGMFHVFTRNTKGLLTKYEEFFGKDLEKTQTYQHDSVGRLIKKVSKSSGYDDFTIFYYTGDSKLMYGSYLQYSALSNNPNDRRHEYRVFVNRYFND
jgi:hypothetical protein